MSPQKSARELGNQKARAFLRRTLFLMGCGRVFEGTHAQMWNSLSKLETPGETRVLICGHEYTQINARFALTVEPGNGGLVARAKRVNASARQGQSTVPATMGEELATNPFLRAVYPACRSRRNAPGDRGGDLRLDPYAKDKF